MTTSAPASMQQLDLLHQLRQAPPLERMYDGLVSLRLTGDLDERRLGEALDALIARHPALRTSLVPTGDGLVQRIESPAPGRWLRTSAPGTTGRDLVRRASPLPLAAILAGRPLFRGQLVRADDGVLLQLRAHHFIADAWSDTIILRDLAELYAAGIEGRSPALPEQTATYADFAERQHALWAGMGESVVTGWRRRLAGHDLSLPWRPPSAPPVDPYACGIVTCTLDAHTAAALTERAREHRTTVFPVLLALTVHALSTVSGRRSVLVGSNVANRAAAERRDAVGYYTNTRLLFVPVGPTAASVVATVRELWLDAAEYDDVYADAVLAGVGRPPVVKIDYSPSAGERLPQLPGVTAQPIPLAGGTPRHWRDLNVTWSDDLSSGTWRMELRYRRAAVDTAAAQDLAAHVVKAARELVGDR